MTTEGVGQPQRSIRLTSVGCRSHISDQAVVLGTIYGQEPMLIHNRLINVSSPKPARAVETWNSHLWDLKS